MSSFRPATRAGVGLLIGIAGPSGSGKTMSALRLARGLSDGDDRAIAFLDTEAGRALHYAAAAGEAPTESTFAFQHADLKPPFTPEAYKTLIEEADDAGFKVIVIDSFSHEWDGEGGLMELHDEIHERMGGQDKQSIAAWKEPKLRHKRLVSRLLQCRAHLVICMRAEDKLRMETIEQTDDRGRTFKRTMITPAKDLPPQERWTPICEKRFPYELITSLVLTPDRPGVPVPLKLQEQHRAFVPLDKPLDEEAGRRLAAWARGDCATRSAAPSLAAVTDGGSVVPPPLPPSSVEYNTVAYDAARPCAIETPLPGELMESSDWRYWSQALASLMDAAPEPRAWLAANAQQLLRLQGLHPNWVAKLEAKASAATPTRAAETEGAPEADGLGLSGAPSQDRGARA